MYVYTVHKTYARPISLSLHFSVYNYTTKHPFLLLLLLWEYGVYNLVFSEWNEHEKLQTANNKRWFFWRCCMYLFVWMWKWIMHFYFIRLMINIHWALHITIIIVWCLGVLCNTQQKLLCDVPAMIFHSFYHILFGFVLHIQKIA